MATTDGTKIASPVSQIVWGNPGKQRPRTDNNNKPIIKQDGTPAMQFVFGLAVPKEAYLRHIHAGRHDLEQFVQANAFERTIWSAMAGEAAKGYPGGVPQNFAWKYDDGDDTRPVNGGGIPYSQREGYPGHYVITIASALDNPPPLFKFNPATGGYEQLTYDQLKTGDFVSVALNIVCNVPEQRTHTPSLYLNPDGIEFVGFGKEIVSASAINPMQAFGGRQHAMPIGASATPLSAAPAGVAMPGGAPMAPAPVQYAPQPMAPAPVAPQPVAAGYPAPAPDFVHGAPQPAPYAPQPMAPAPVQYAPAPVAPQPYAPQPMPGGMPPR